MKQDKIMAVDKRIQGIRVYVDGKSREIQEKLFELGAEWNSGDKEEMNTEAPFLYIDKDGRMFHGNCMVNFTGWGGTEVKADELLSLSHSPSWSPFKRCWCDKKMATSGRQVFSLTTDDCLIQRNLVTCVCMICGCSAYPTRATNTFWVLQTSLTRKHNRK